MKYVLLSLVAAVVIALIHANVTAEDWRTASRAPVGLAPDPATTPEAVIQVYAARAVRWRGYFGVHTWIAVKPALAERFTVHEVNGWRLRRTGSAVVQSDRPPDGRWFGSEPELLADARGPEAELMIQRVQSAVASYPYADQYRVWPGPNSNTFTAHVLREVGELPVDLPPTAIGKDFLDSPFAATAPSGTGFQLNLLGALGILAAGQEGLEVNVLGLVFGLDARAPALKLPMIGRIEIYPFGLLALPALVGIVLVRRRT
ncbi:MAG: DUF3750 domain-containing protein [Gammaproteobacteria bacterium]|nr:DUF3750 domain-containing protein [Gammaproteobacteria bacterium]